MTLHVIGNICVDFAMRVPALPGPGETVNAVECLRGPGGKGANQALAATRAGANVRFFSAVGQDAEGSRLIDRATTAGLPVADIARMDTATDMSVVLVAASAENIVASCVDCARAIGDETAGAVARALRPGDAMLLQGNLTKAATEALAASARKAGIRLAVNASPLDSSAFPSCDLLVVNRGEAQSLSGNSDIEAAIDTLHARGARDVVVTLGAEGAVGLCGGKRFRREAIQVKAVDTSGAGDIFCGVVVALWHAGAPLPEAVGVAAGAAALAVTRPGTFDSCPTRDEIQAIMLRKD
ncbi:PfkB family carbohydrate kinase [Aureimonas altamirensis]|uniref:PfkB family carbohydrate kinase n=1 Tax=Aureimonas altamirensis TaxID=370622 RepID=UPI0025559908|nr:PfkB family carbohydrate kinase [Aureimonas altamirensis]